MTAPDIISLPSGVTIARPTERLRRFCDEEYAYYDAIPDQDPNHVLPIDVLATVSMNSFVNNAPRVRLVRRGMAARCDTLLPAIPAGADLLSFDPSLASVERLLHAAVQAPWVLVPVATKVLHRKRPHLIPMLDNVVLEYYLTALDQQHIAGRTQDKRHAAGIAAIVLRAFRDDLRQCQPALLPLQEHLAGAGYRLSLVRIVELLVWTEAESNGYYRQPQSQ